MAMVAWAVIIWCVGYVALVNWRAAGTTARVEAAEDIELLLTSRILVGTAHWLPRSDGKDPAGLSAQMLARIGPGDGAERELRLVSVIGELEGAKAAEAALDRCAPRVTDPRERDDLATLRTIYGRGPAAVPADARAKLASHQGWFADLALSFGLPDDEPLRARVLHQARMAAFAAMGIEMAIGFGLLAGLALLVIAIVRIATGRLHLCYRPAPGRTTAFLESFAVYLGGYVLIGVLMRRIGHGSMLSSFALLILWLPVAMLWPLFRGATWRGLRGGLGWYVGQGFFREVGAGIAGYLAGMPLVGVAVLVSVFLAARTHSSMTHPLVFSNTRDVWAVVELYLLAAVFAPLVEETMFRGALFNHLRQRHGWLLSAGVSSFIFAALHPQGWAAIPVLGAIGLVLASIREWRGTFIASVAAHALNNGVVMTFVILALR
jgi:membrane protease YdiL (CAAX protease family)